MATIAEITGKTSKGLPMNAAEALSAFPFHIHTLRAVAMNGVRTLIIGCSTDGETPSFQTVVKRTPDWDKVYKYWLANQTPVMGPYILAIDYEALSPADYTGPPAE